MHQLTILNKHYATNFKKLSDNCLSGITQIRNQSPQEINGEKSEGDETKVDRSQQSRQKVKSQ